MEFKLKRFTTSVNVTRIANIHYFEFTKKYHTFKDSHPFRELVYVDSGSINVEAENYSGKLMKNQLITHCENEIHSLTCFEDNAPNVIIIGFECKTKCLDLLSASPITLSYEEQRTLTNIIREGRAVFLPPYDVPNLKDMKKRSSIVFGADQMIKLLLEQLLIQLVRGKEAKSEYTENNLAKGNIYDIHEYIKENFREHISLSDLCFLYNTNKTTLCTQFKLGYGVTVTELINNLRIKEAKRLMREGNFNLTQIAENVGFSSIHYFSRAFKIKESRSPSEYIKTIKARLENS